MKGSVGAKTEWCSVRLVDACTRFPAYRSVSVPTTLRRQLRSRPQRLSGHNASITTHISRTAARCSVSCVSCGASKGSCLVMLLCRSSPVLCRQSSITAIRCWSVFPQSSWTDCSPSSTHQLVWSVMLWRQITLHQCWKTYTGYESRKGSCISYVSLRSSVNIVWHHHTCQTNFNMSLEWSPDSVWDHRVPQRSSYQLLEVRH